MKYGTKMILVPFGRDTPAENKLTELDSELQTILKNKNFPKDDKIKFYNQVLSRYLTINENIRNQNATKLGTMKESFVNKKSDDPVNEFKSTETKSFDGDLKESREYDEYLYDDNDYLSADNQSTGTTREISLEDMERINNSIMQKSPSFDLIKENNKDQNKLLKPKKNPMQLSDKKTQLIKSLFNWTTY